MNRLEYGNVCYHSVQNLSCLLSKHVNIRIYKTIVLPVILNDLEAWSLILWKEHGLMGV
jgi:hypothetical protein